MGKTATEIARRREKVEALMLMEFTRYQILELMGDVPERTLDRDISEIKKKWQADGKDLNHREQLREQMLRKAKKAENKAWVAESKAITSAEKTGAIRTALRAQERQAKLLGLDIERVEGTVNLGGKVQIETDLSKLSDEDLIARAEEAREAIARAAEGIGGGLTRARRSRKGA